MADERFVISADDTRIAYQTRGKGPGLVIVPGNNRMAHNYELLADHLSGEFTVHVMERRGRGASGPQGKNYRVEKEADDLQSVLAATGSHLVFGHSYGGLIALECARSSSPIGSLVVFEPGVSINGSFDLSWLPRFTAEFERGRKATALAVFLCGTKLLPFRLPLPLMRVFTRILLTGASGQEMRDLMHTTPAEMSQIARLDSDGKRYATATARTLLLGGVKTPSYLTGVLPVLGRIIPDAQVKIIAGLDHNAPDLNAPSIIADRLIAFYRQPAVQA